MTSNPARLLKLRHKGSIAVGADADLLVLSHDTLQLRYLYVKGVLRKTPQWTQVSMLLLSVCQVMSRMWVVGGCVMYCQVPGS
jgi:predicted amidohydrolase